MPLTEQDLVLMRRAYLFAGMAEADYREVVEYAHTVRLTTGQTLFQQDTPFTALYWVAEGMIRLYRVSPHGEEKVIELIGPGRSFAEAVMFMGGNYPVCASALMPSRLIAIDGVRLRQWLAQDTARCFRLMAVMSMRMHKLVGDIEQLTLMKGTDRLLQYLLDHADPDETGRQVVELKAPKLVIASRLGIKPETFSRLLHKLSDQGLIEVHENRVYLLDPERMLRVGHAGLAAE